MDNSFILEPLPKERNEHQLFKWLMKKPLWKIKRMAETVGVGDPEDNSNYVVPAMSYHNREYSVHFWKKAYVHTMIEEGFVPLANYRY